MQDTMHLADRMSVVKPSPTLAIAAKAAELTANGVSVMDLSTGEPDYDTPDAVKVAGIEAICSGKTKYTSVVGIPALRKAIALKIKDTYDLEYNPAEIIVGNGAKQVLFNALFATINAGDEVIIPMPYWVSYPDMVLLAGGVPVFVECDSQFKLSSQMLASKITPKTRWLILNSPNNPTGAVYTESELKQLAEVLLRHPHVQILSDDIYEHIVFDRVRFYSLISVEPSLRERALIVNGFSKSHSMTGWRVGYGVGPAKLIKAMSTLQSQITSNVCSISQYAALAALSETESARKGKALFESRRNIVVDMLKNAKGLTFHLPQGAFYLFINCEQIISLGKGSDLSGVKSIDSSLDFADYLLGRYRVAVVPGEAFGMRGYFRISYAVKDSVLVEGCKRIVDACQELM